jgi:hypothetical protein
LSGKAYGVLVFGLTTLGVSLLSLPAHAISGFTTITYGTPVNIDGTPVDGVQMSWSTNLDSGIVTQNDLTNWTLQVMSAGNPIYTDNAIINSVVQAIGGVTRPLSNLVFSFNLGTNTLTNWDNDFNIVQNGAASGTTYNIYLFNGNSNTSKFVNGALIAIGPTTNFSQNTTITADAVPFEFSPGLGLILLGVGYGLKQGWKRWRTSPKLELEPNSAQ